MAAVDQILSKPQKWVERMFPQNDDTTLLARPLPPGNDLAHHW